MKKFISIIMTAVMVAFSSGAAAIATTEISTVCAAETSLSKPSVTKLFTKTNKKIFVKWGKVIGADGYQIKYSTSSDFSTDKTYILVENGSTVKKTLSNLGLGKTHYIRVRAYKLVGNKKSYSKWSSVQSVKVTAKICIDPGHVYTENSYGEKDNVVDGYSEATMTLTLGKYLRTYLKEYGFSVVMTRTTANAPSLSLEDRGPTAEGCDFFISLHSNAPDDGSKTSTINVVKGFACVDGTADALSNKLIKAAAKAMGADSYKLYHKDYPDQKGTDYYAVLRGAKSVGVSGVIIEHSYHTTKSVREWLENKSNLKKLAKAEADAFASYYGAKKTDDTKSSSTDTGVSLNKSSLTVYAGGMSTLKATSGSKVTWKSSDTSVAKVSSGGVVTGVKKGTATITASANGKTAKCKVTVKAETLVKYKTTDTVNYRSSPSTSGAKKGSLAKGKTVKVVKGYSKSANGYTWYKIKIGQKYYYIASDFLTKA